jgi:hypothetical protein
VTRPVAERREVQSEATMTAATSRLPFRWRRRAPVTLPHIEAWRGGGMRPIDGQRHNRTTEGVGGAEEREADANKSSKGKPRGVR